MAADYPAWSDYNYVLGNPIMFIDPDWRSAIVSTRVTENDDGTYTVVGGNKDDGDNGIYLDQNGENGELIAYSATPESFYYSETNTWLGTIDPMDNSGRDFLNDQVIAGDPSLVPYMYNATGGEKYDFKRTNGTESEADDITGTTDEDIARMHRGMPLSLFGDNKSLPVYASARDIGNIGAGLIAGRAGIGWIPYRLIANGLESAQKGEFSTESTATQYAQRLGHRIGSDLRSASAKTPPLTYGDTNSKKPISKSIIKKNGL